MGNLAGILPIIIMFVLFYFLLIRPQQKRQKNVQAMQSSLSKGDKVVTIGGLHAIVDSIDDNKVVLKCGDGSRLTFDRSAIREVTESKAASVAETKKVEEPKPVEESK
ncbi:preprotein translocase subunit YajC [Heyndrickxia ginsengihumi]|uniref:Preprotein translocase subunit YajC n=1 Tax=Heyndrickxia ginsengihumi TaxID=363870 RepID=A0A0A6VJS9_9BACI|nr:preprotein translocase subunit YajC [Heyndrickxia ginsengihumi]KHD86859.1 preprotein translocase subunit YajC [Heyndrickxia ginsengihumi]MBE6184167.1 preprotein translocase subunit YajC [Bacillus sp. (in: firmicutes)]MCM3021860.1 preprotein translocase subunit YajC [Heyndrickxia ginsengihumi]NEY20453.1 preprotein translocase subunit YajC [Heyndrickxia ginsengihumi]